MLGYEDLNTNLSINEDWWYEGVYALLIASISDIIKNSFLLFAIKRPIYKFQRETSRF